MPTAAAVYLRVSTERQSHDSQRAEMEDYCRRRGWTDVRWYTDTASGAKQSREGLKELMDQVRRGKVEAVITFKLDRLARSLVHPAPLIAELQAHRMALVRPSQGAKVRGPGRCQDFDLATGRGTLHKVS